MIIDARLIVLDETKYDEFWSKSHEFTRTSSTGVETTYKSERIYFTIAQM